MGRRYNPNKHRLPKFDKSGIILVDKPADWTSHDVVNFVRNRFNVPKVGHCGTLDPAATGLLVLVLGRFTKLSQKFSGEDKVYESTILLGKETDTQDMEGEVIAEHDASAVTDAQFREVIESFVGEQEQVPPMVSAVKQDGKKLYDLARQGIEVEREARQIVINSIDISRVELPYADFTVSCSKGTYIRTLCDDIGRKLGCGGVLYALKRIASGSFKLDQAVTVDQIKEWEQADLAVYVMKMLHEQLAKMDEFSDF
jgi:tRNA pseudouridine55 synthase